MLRQVFAVISGLLFAAAIGAYVYATMLGGEIDTLQTLGRATGGLEDTRSTWVTVAAVSAVGGLATAFVSVLMQAMED